MVFFNLQNTLLFFILFGSHYHEAGEVLTYRCSLFPYGPGIFPPQAHQSGYEWGDFPINTWIPLVSNPTCSYTKVGGNFQGVCPMFPSQAQSHTPRAMWVCVSLQPFIHSCLWSPCTHRAVGTGLPFLKWEGECILPLCSFQLRTLSRLLESPY